MVITFYGEGCFKLQSGDFVILTDLFDNKIGLTPPRLKPDIILKTLTALPFSQDLSPNASASDKQYLIYGPGEYNIQNANIAGFPLSNESSEKFLKTAYFLEVEGINLCFLGHLSETPEPSLLEYLEETEVLFIPAGGPPFIEQKMAAKIIKQIQPKIVIPCFFKIPGLKRKADDVRVFLEEFNGSKKERTAPQEKLTIKKKDLSDIKKTEIVVLKP